MRIAQISDLHVSSQYYVPEWGDNVIRWINGNQIDLVLVSGDLTMDGHPHEFDMALEFLDAITPPKMVVPGNHDAKNKGYCVFEEIFGKRKPTFENDEVVILGLDSSEPDIDDGQIGRHDYPLIKEQLSSSKISILFLHHHIIPIPGTGRERNILTDAGDVLQACIETGVDLVLSGHRHLPWSWRIDDSYFVTAGTACTRRLKGRTGPSFNLIEVDQGGFSIQEIDSRYLSTRPVIPNGHHDAR
jgi:3',5'-cyclic AMP phosphodiesterase CpdA